MTQRCAAVLLASLLSSTFQVLFAQHPQLAQHPGDSAFSRKNTFSIFGEYSNDSSHILIGQAENRKLAGFGFGYERRLHSWDSVEMHYLGELRPVLFESDPVVHQVSYVPALSNSAYTLDFTQITSCKPRTTTIEYPPSPGVPAGSVTYVDTCRRQWTYGQALSPLGIKFNFLPRRRVQPVFTVLAGYVFSTKPIPIAQAGSFNYSFEFGAGIEFFRSRAPSSGRFGARALRAEYRYHHISNAYTAAFNPGIDNGLLQITYSFGR